MPKDPTAAAPPVQDRVEILEGRPVLGDEGADEVGLDPSALEEDSRIRMAGPDLSAQTGGRKR